MTAKLHITGIVADLRIFFLGLIIEQVRCLCCYMLSAVHDIGPNGSKNGEDVGVDTS